MGRQIKGADGRDCEATIAHPNIKLSGRQTSTVYFDNPSRRNVNRVEVDDCVITEGLRCDWLLRTDDQVSREDIFVELKGADIAHAIKQLEATIPQLARAMNGVVRRCYVVHTRCPMAGTDINNYKLRFKKHFNAMFETVRDGNSVQL